VGAGEEKAIEIANEAVKRLSEWNAEEMKSKKRYFFLSLLPSK
jgi:hypothetical protein